MAFLHNDREQFAEAISITAYQTGVMAQAVEKDYYVSLILRRLSQQMPFIVFKGGTSLSKCHGVIKRFSEDIDITIDTQITQSQKKAVKDTAVAIADELGMTILNLGETHSRRDYNKYIIAYASVLPTASAAVQSAVQMETSYKTISFPTVVLPVRNYIGTMMETEAPELIDGYELDPFNTKVQDLDRTLADKVFALCDYYLQGKTEKHSRHLYDIYMLLPHVKLDQRFKALVEEVREDRKASPVCPSAQDGVDVPGLLKRIVDEAVYRDDYDELTEKLLEERVAYEEAVEAIGTVIVGGVFEL